MKPGELRTVRFTLTPADLSYWTSAKHGWVQDATTFDLCAGNSSQAVLGASFEVRQP